MKFLVFLLFLSISIESFGARSKRVHCKKMQLPLKACYLEYKEMTLRFSKDKIIYNDGVRHTLHEFPMPDSPDWKSISIYNVGKRTFLELKLWTAPKTLAKVQDLQWIIIEIGKGLFKQHLSKSVQKKRISTIKGQPANISDPMIYHKLKALPSGKVRWYVGRESKII